MREHAATSLPQIALSAPQPSALLSSSTLKWIDHIRVKYDAPGFGIGLIASPNCTGSNWRTEVLGFGQRDHQGQPYDINTIFRLASNSKLFTALSIGLLINNGTILKDGHTKLSYNTKIKDIIPDWQLQDRYMQNHMDILDLLTVRSGMPDHTLSYRGDEPFEHIRQLRNMRPSTEIRQTFQYASQGYWVLAEVVRHLSGQSYPDFVQTHLLDPIGMSHSTYNHTVAAQTGRLASSYLRRGLDNTKCREVWDTRQEIDQTCYGRPVAVDWFLEGDLQDGLFFAGPTGLASSFNDMLKWLRELLDPKVIPRHTLAETHKSFMPANGVINEADEVGKATYGQGQIISSYRGHEILYHHGNQPGAGSLIVRLPARGIGIIIAENEPLLGLSLQHIVLFHPLDDLLGLDPIDWESRIVTPRLKSGLYSHWHEGAPQPRITRPGLRADSLIGVYYDPAYGYLNITHFNDTTGLDVTADAFQDEYYRMHGAGHEPLYIARMSNIYAHGMIFAHSHGPVYDATLFTIRKRVDGVHFPLLPMTHRAVFVGGDGVGLFNNFWSGAVEVDAVEEDVQEKAEVWFAKIR